MRTIILLCASLAAASLALLPTTRAQAQSTSAVFYEEDPAEPRGREFVGSAVWRTETIRQLPELAIRADVEIPERNLEMIWWLRRNTDSSVPSFSHVIEMMFKLRPDLRRRNLAEHILDVSGMLMTRSRGTRGVPLKGVTKKDMPGIFLLGLSVAEREYNVQLLLKEGAWLEIAIAYSDGHRAILSVEKGTPGERVFAEAFAAWRR
jgi:hypothetical protein